MARRPRLELTGVPVHVIQRGNNRGVCFHADSDRRLYLRCLAEAIARHQCALHAYALMPNHVHLLVTPLAVGSVAATMQDLGRRYVRLFNDTYQRTGTLWEGRYKSTLVDTESYLLTCHRYIELNPVRGRLVEHPVQYRWSSHRHYALGAANPLITRHAIFNQIADEEALRRNAFVALCREAIDPQAIDKIRSATNQGWALGSDSFLDEIEAALGRSARPPKRGRPSHSPNPTELSVQDQKMLI